LVKVKKKVAKKAATHRQANIRSMGGTARRGDSGHTAKARLILKHAHDSARAFLLAFAGVRKLRDAKRGAPTDEEQDLLRAMVVFAAAGLDSMVKQLIKDTLPDLIRLNESVRKGLEGFVARELRGDSATTAGNQFLARILVSESQRDQLIDEYVVDLTGASLQSADELVRAANALGLEPRSVGINPRALRPLFVEVRNRIIHELDIDFDHPNRNRKSRSRRDMTRGANTLLEIGEKVLVAVEQTLRDLVDEDEVITLPTYPT
jgi:hypothetical protein